jgi:hypothetical protein
VTTGTFFVERESLENRQVNDLVGKQSPCCEMVLACDSAQALNLISRRRFRARVLFIVGGLADGRAADLHSRLKETTQSFDWVVFVDRRHCRGSLAEAAPETMALQLRPSLTDGWLVVRFLDRRRPTAPSL